MNILVLSWRDLKHPLAGGAEQVMHEHMKGWISVGHKVTLFSSKMPELKNAENIDGIKVIRTGYQYLGVQIAAFFYYLGNKDKYDFVVDQFHGIPFFTPLYVKKPKLAVIQEAARKVWFLNPLPIPLNWIVGVIGYTGEPFIFLIYKKVPFMTGSNSAKEDLVKIGIPERNITIVNHGTLIIQPDRNIKREKVPTIVYLGRLSKDKGIEDALMVFSILEYKIGNINFWIIGSPETKEYGEKIKNLSDKLNLKNIKFWGFVSQKEKFEILVKSHVMINPSTREGWGLVNIEANSMGVPVVAYGSPGLVDSVKNGLNGVICDENTPEKMAEEVFDLVYDKEKLAELSKRAIKISKNFTWAKSIEKSNQLLTSLYKRN